MKTKTKPKLKVIKILFVFCSFFLMLSFIVMSNWTDTYVHIVMCDVGQGDSILIYRGFFQVLIDSGRDDGVLTCLQENIPFWDKDLEMIVVSHYDLDHIGCFGNILDSYNVKTILAPTDTKDTNEYKELQIGFKNEQLNGAIYKEPIFGDIISLQSGGSFTILSPWFDGDLESYDEIKNSPDVSSDFGKNKNLEHKTHDSLSFDDKNSKLLSFGEKSNQTTETGLLDVKEDKVIIGINHSNKVFVSKLRRLNSPK